MNIARKRGIRKRLPAECKLSKDEVDVSNDSLSNESSTLECNQPIYHLMKTRGWIENGRQISTCESDVKESGIGDVKAKGHFRLMKRNAKRSGSQASFNDKGRNGRRNSDLPPRTDPPACREQPPNKGSSLDLEDLRFPAEYEPPAVDYSRRRSSAHRVSYRKAIQKAGYNMNELVTTTKSNATTPTTPQNPTTPLLTEVDWSDAAGADHHIWAPTTASGELCCVMEEHCQKSGPRKRCDACHIIAHELCYPQVVKMGFRCKATFREAAARNTKEPSIMHHHWVHRKKQEGKCKSCSKSFEKRFGFRESTKIIAISCSWCKEAYHNKVQCFHLHKLEESCTLGAFAKSIVPPTWIVKTSKQKSVRNRSKKRKGTSGALKKKSTSKEFRPKTFVLRPFSHQAAFLTPVLVFINPKSGGRQGSKLLQSFRWFLNPRQVFDLSQDSPQEAIELYRRVPNLRILACGGDGTVGWILSVLDKLNLSRPPPVAILPLGTGNDLSRTLNFGPGYTDEPVRKIFQGVEDAKMVKLDRWKLSAEKNEDVTKMADDDELHSDSNADGTDKLPLDVVNNYFSIGSDAQVSFNFHESREAHPAKFTSRLGNKIFYARAGVSEYLTRQLKNLFKHVKVVCDGIDITGKIRDHKAVCILFLNIPRFSSGTTPWGHPAGNEFHAQSHDDKLIEVLAFSINQLGMLFVGGHGERLCQCRSAVIQTNKVFPVQIDGEPCKLNPSNIRLEFFNQANMLMRCKRTSVIVEPLPSPEQIKIRINLIRSDAFEGLKGKKEQLCSNSFPLLVTVVLNQSTLDTVRSCLLLTLNEQEDRLSDKWVFLDSSSRDKLYKIDRFQESRLLISDVISSDKEVYILNIAERSNVAHGHKANNGDWHRSRIKSDSVLSSISSSSESHSNVEPVVEKIKMAGVPASSYSPDPTSAYLDVVFEQPEIRGATVDLTHSSVDAVQSNQKGDFATNSLPSDHTTQGPATPKPPNTPQAFNSPYRSSSASTASREAYTRRNAPMSLAFASQLSLDETRPSGRPTLRRRHSDASGSSDYSFLASESADATSLNMDEDMTNSPRGFRERSTEDSDRNGPLAHWEKIFFDSAKRGDCELVRRAIEHGVDPCLRDMDGCTALHYAVRFSYEALVDCLLAEDSDIVDLVCFDRKQTALHKAAWYGRTETCKKLVAAGASVEVKDYKDMTPSDIAKHAGVEDLVDFLQKILLSKQTGKPFHETDL